MPRSFVGVVPPGGGYGRWLQRVVSDQGFCVIVGHVGTLTVASLLDVAFLFSLLSLGYFLDLFVCCSLWASSGPCCVLGAQEF